MLVRPAGVRAAGDAATRAVLSVCERLRAARISGVRELAPAPTTVAIFYDPAELPLDELQRCVLDALAKVPAGRQRSRPPVVEIPVCYGEEFGPDLRDVASHARRSPSEVVACHSAAKYRVGCIGFTPGFPYLTGLPAALTTPRRSTPRARVAAGSVAIGGAQAGIYPADSPGGWNVIGRTPLRLFEIEREPPSLLRVGNEVRFRAITRAEFDALNR